MNLPPAIALIAVVCCINVTADHDWPQWRGPRDTGETVWKVDAWDDASERKLSGSENDGGSGDFTRNNERAERLRGLWSTPILANIGGKTQLLATLPRHVASFNPANGRLNWVCGGGAPLACALPMESDGIVVGLGGDRGASLAVRDSGEGDITESKRVR